jgi:hypothetical protein
LNGGNRLSKKKGPEPRVEAGESVGWEAFLLADSKGGARAALGSLLGFCWAVLRCAPPPVLVYECLNTHGHHCFQETVFPGQGNNEGTLSRESISKGRTKGKWNLLPLPLPQLGRAGVHHLGRAF